MPPIRLKKPNVKFSLFNRKLTKKNINFSNKKVSLKNKQILDLKNKNVKLKTSKKELKKTKRKRSDKRNKKSNEASRTHDIERDTFAAQKLSDYKKSKIARRRVRPYHIIKNKSIRARESTFLVYKDGVLYRNMKPNTYKIWADLYSKKVAVEPIISLGAKSEINALKKIGCQLDKGEVLVKSKSAGVSFLLHPDHPNPKINTIQTLQKSNLIKELSLHKRMNIARQILKTTLDVWDQGYIHRHPHGGNWALDVKDGKFKVTLIDLDVVSKLSRTLLSESPYVDYHHIKNTMKDLELPKDYTNKLLNVLEKRVEKILDG